MKVIGIVAEYNPFHNGHAYQIAQIRKQTHADFIVVAISGDFVQRGTPAIIDKYARTKMALSCGADLVLELPVIWATASAESFAMAGVTLFDKMGCVDGICFGAETDDLPLLNKIAELLAAEPQGYRDALSSYLKEGLAFPAARANALCDYLTGDSCPTNCRLSNEPDWAYDADTLCSTLNEPNNILAIEYLKAIKKRGSALTPHLIKREGAGYHEAEIQNVDNTPTASATAIRNALAELSSQNTQNFSDTDSSSAHTLISLSETMPAPALNILCEYLNSASLLCENDFSSILGYLLLSRSVTEIANVADSNEEIANRLVKNRFQYTTLSEFCALNKSRDITYTRMSRILLHLLLNMTDTDYNQGKSLDYIPYLRVLGFRKDSSALLGELKKTTTIPVISKLADAKNILCNDSFAILEKDIFAADLYEQLCAQKSSNNFPCHAQKKANSRSEYTREIVII